jgi:hypothetical protein
MSKKAAWNDVAGAQSHAGSKNRSPGSAMSTPPPKQSPAFSAKSAGSAGGIVDVAVLPSWGMHGAQHRRPTDTAVFSHYPHSSAANAKVVLWQGDIIKLKVDGIVNAANSSLRGVYLVVSVALGRHLIGHAVCFE